MADPQAPVIIIRKKKGGGHAGHHGGAWKVAYADFVTAMMSFFLLLWLLNVTTDVERKGIADYFAPASISKSESGAGGVMGGQTITTNGAEMSFATPPTTQNETIPTVGQGDEGDEETKGQNQGASDGKATQGSDVNKPNQAANDNGASTLSKEDQAMADKMKGEEEAFKKAEDVMKQAIAASPELSGFANQIVIDRTPEGLRIQIIDRDKFSMFPSGGAVPYEKARDLMILVGKVITRMPNNISVTGHTDGTPFTVGSGRDNWTLSTERANVSREYLVSAGVDEKRIARVSGLADRDPFVPNDPKDPRNRRISIVLLRQAIPPSMDPPSSPK
jgi:chemotaxis protein MotB